MTKEIVTYEPDNSIKNGYLPIFREIYDEIKKNRWLTYQLFRRDFLSTYRQSLMGIVWALIIPLVGLSTFILLNQAGIFSMGDMTVPYPIYAILGLAFWQLFATGLIASSNSLVKAGSMLTKINFSKKSLVIASMGQSIIPFLIQIVFVCILFAYYQVSPSIAILLIPITIIPIILLTLGLGFILSVLNGVARDVGNIISILITFLLFLTPILYQKPTTGFLALMTEYNPLYYLISGSRDLVLSGTIPEWGGMVVSSIIALICFILFIVIFHLTETRIAERI